MTRRKWTAEILKRLPLYEGLLRTGVHGMGDEHEDILTVVLPAQVFIDRVRGPAIGLRSSEAEDGDEVQVAYQRTGAPG